MLRKFFYLVAVVFFILSIHSCSDSVNIDDENSIDQTSRIQLKLVDSPGDYLEVNIEIIDIQYNNSEDEGGWVSFAPASGYPINVDLTELIAGNSLLLADEVIPSGMIQKIRLVLSDNNTLVIEREAGNETVDLSTPSAQQSGLKLHLNTELEPGFSYTFILDWDVQRSIVRAGNSGRYNLKPVIRVIPEVNSGSIQGNVVGKMHMNNANPVALENVTVLVFSVDDLVNSIGSTQTNIDGDFLFQGLAEGQYIFKIMHAGYQDYETSIDSAINVSVGVVTELDENIELLLSESIIGKVIGKLNADATEAVALENVEVLVFSVDNVILAIANTQTDTNGDFLFQGLSEGQYILKIMHTGYQDYETSMDSSINVEVGIVSDVGSVELLLE